MPNIGNPVTNLAAWAVNFVINPTTKEIFLTGFTIFFIALMKIISKRNSSGRINVDPEVFAFGLDISTTSLILVLTKLMETLQSLPKDASNNFVLNQSLMQQLIFGLVILLISFLLITLITFITLKFGWRDIASPSGITTEITVWGGIIIPNLIGIFLFSIVTAPWR